MSGELDYPRWLSRREFSVTIEELHYSPLAGPDDTAKTWLKACDEAKGKREFWLTIIHHIEDQPKETRQIELRSPVYDGTDAVTRITALENLFKEAALAMYLKAVHSLEPPQQ